MQRVNLTYYYGTKEVSKSDSMKFRCFLMEGCYETTTLGSFAYTWDTAKNCAMTKILTEDAKMLHYTLTTDQNETQFYFLSEFNDSGEGINIKLKIFPESNQLCGKPERLYKTNTESLFVNYQGDFAMPGGERWRTTNKEYSSTVCQFLINNTRQVFYTSLNFSELNGKWVGAHKFGVLSARMKLIMNCTWKQNWSICCVSTPSN